MNDILSPQNEKQESLPTDTVNEFVYTIIDQQGKMVLGINAHGDVVVNELIARQINNAELGAIATEITKLTKLITTVTNALNANYSVLSYLASVINGQVSNVSENSNS